MHTFSQCRSSFRIRRVQEEGMNRVHLYLRRDPFCPRNFKGTIKPVVLVIKNQSSPVHFCLGRKKEIINLYCNPLSKAIIFFPRREGGLEWKGTCHVFQHSLHEEDYCGAQPCLSISRLKKDRQMEYSALENF